MTDIIERLKEPEAHYPGNFDTPKRANAMLSCLCQEAMEEIESLRQQLAEKDAEVERLSRLNSSYSNLTKAQEGQLTALRNRLYELKGADKTLDSERDANAILTEQLAASQAREQQLRENVRLVCGPVMDAFTDGQRWNDYQEIIDHPQDTSALEALIAKAGEVMRERCAVECETHYNFSNALAAAIRALPGVTLEDIK